MTTYSAVHREYYLKNRERILSKRKEREQAWLATPKGKYSAQKRKAKQRGIDWAFTFDSWWSMWKDSWEQRGDSTGKYCMARFGDTGEYSPTNCYITLFESNTKEVYLRNGTNKQGQFNSNNMG